MTTKASNQVKSKTFFFLKRADGIWQTHYEYQDGLDFIVCVFLANEQKDVKFCYAKDVVFDGYVPRLEFIPHQVRDLVEQEISADLGLADTAFYKLRRDANWERCSLSDGEARLIVCTTPPRSPAYNTFCGAVDLASGQEIELLDLPIQVIKDLNLIKQ